MTELRDLALRVVQSTDLELKLAATREELTDDHPGEPLRLTEPGRPPGLEIRPAEETRVPRLGAMPDPSHRARIVHALANHELQAAELFAWALLAFPGAPPEYRRGLARILDDEQRHTRMYIARVEAVGHRFGDFPVSGYFWNKIDAVETPAAFVCAMSLTFENANLDHTVEYAAAARESGDEKLAKVIDAIHRDEIEHVRFGWRWLAELKDPGETMWEAYRARQVWPLAPDRARGKSFYEAGRRAAGLDDEFIGRLRASQR
jgi:uncharacterized ferritin-like protein (DUF455 family)